MGASLNFTWTSFAEVFGAVAMGLGARVRPPPDAVPRGGDGSGHAVVAGAGRGAALRGAPVPESAERWADGLFLWSQGTWRRALLGFQTCRTP